MEPDTPLQCSGGCANCPRRKQCAAAAPQPVEPTTPAAPPTTPATPPAAPVAPSSENAALEDFLKENPSRGVLRVQAFRGNQAIPVKGVDVTVSRRLRDGTNYVFYTGTTDESGLVDAIALPASERQQSVEPGEPHPDAAYQLVARHPEFETVTATVNIFPGIKTVQPVQLQLRRSEPCQHL